MRDSLYLIDTSVWVDVLPPGQATSGLRERVDTLLASDRVAITGMVRLELLGGARSEADYRRLSEMLSALHRLPVTDEHWDQAAQLGFHLRRQGLSMPFTDLLIAAVALVAGATILHRDRHFDLMARHVPLHVESYAPTG